MKIQDALLLVLIAFIWGFNFVVIRWGLDYFPPLLFSALRFSVCALPIVFGVKRPDIPFKSLIALGVTLGLLVFGLLYLAIYAGLNAGMASAVMQAQVFFTLLLSILLLGERMSKLGAVALVTGFVGLIFIFTHGGNDAPALGFFLALSAALSWGISNLIIKTLPKVRMLNLMVWISLIPPLPLFALSWLFEGQTAVLTFAGDLNPSGLLVILYTSALSTVVAYGVWGTMLQRYSAAAVSPFALLVPVFGLASAVLCLGTHLSAIDLIGPALVVIALILNWIGTAGRSPKALWQPAFFSSRRASPSVAIDSSEEPSRGTP